MSDNEDGNEDNDDSDSDMVEVTHEDNEAAKDELSVSEFKKFLLMFFKQRGEKARKRSDFPFLMTESNIMIL